MTAKESSKVLTHLTIGEVVNHQNGTRLTVNDFDILRVALLRGLTIGACKSNATIPLGKAAEVLGVADSAIGRYQELLDVDCVRRSEPSLASVVVNATTGENSEWQGAYLRPKVYRYWSNH